MTIQTITKKFYLANLYHKISYTFFTLLYAALLLIGAAAFILSLENSHCFAENWQRIAMSKTTTYRIDLDTVITKKSGDTLMTYAWIKYEHKDKTFVIEYVGADRKHPNTLKSYDWYAYDTKGNAPKRGNSQGMEYSFAKNTFGAAVYNTLIANETTLLF